MFNQQDVWQLKTAFPALLKTNQTPLKQTLCYEIKVHERLAKIFGSTTEIENTSWKVLAYGIYARVVDVSEIE